MATALERQCAGLRARGVRNAMIMYGEEPSDLDPISDEAVQAIAKRIRYADDGHEDLYDKPVDQIVDRALVRELPEAYISRWSLGWNETRLNEPIIVAAEDADAYVVCFNMS